MCVSVRLAVEVTVLDPPDSLTHRALAVNHTSTHDHILYGLERSSYLNMDTHF